MAKNTLRVAADFAGGVQPDRLRDGTTTGTAAKGYGNHYGDGSSYDKYGWRVDLSQTGQTQFK